MKKSKISKQAAKAFVNGVNFKSGTTDIFTDGDGVTHFILDDNEIAIRKYNGKIKIGLDDFYGNIKTAMSRLNCIQGIKLKIKNNQLFLNGDIWDGTWIYLGYVFS